MIAVTSPRRQLLTVVTCELLADLGYRPAALDGHLTVHDVAAGGRVTIPHLPLDDHPAFDLVVETHRARRAQFVTG